MKTQLQILLEGAALARRQMRLEAKEWRLLVAIQAKSHFQRAMLSRAIQARDCARDLERVAKELQGQP